MKYIKSIFEAVIDWRGQGLEEFEQEVLDAGIPMRVARFREIAEEHGIEVVDYETFLEELPDDEYRAAAPPRRTPVFATVNPVTMRPRVVLQVPIVDHRLWDYVFHMLKHEGIHVQQWSRREVHPGGLWDVRDRGAYFSQKDEVMAFSHSIVDQLLGMGARTPEEGIRRLGRVRLYQDIRGSVSKKILKRYHKLIYLYLLKELGEE